MEAPDDVKYLNLAVHKEVMQAIENGMINGNDSPKGFLCTLCGAMVASKRLHTDYHGTQYLLFRYATADRTNTPE